MNHSIFGCATLVCALFATEAAAQQIVTLDDWVGTVNRQVERALVMPTGRVSGQSTVAFRRGADGKPVDVTVVSGDRRIAAAAHRTVTRLRNLPPLPSGFPSTQRIQMNMLIGDPNHKSKYDAQSAKLHGLATALNARLAQRSSNVSVASIDR